MMLILEVSASLAILNPELYTPIKMIVMMMSCLFLLTNSSLLYTFIFTSPNYACTSSFCSSRYSRNEMCYHLSVIAINHSVFRRNENKMTKMEEMTEAESSSSARPVFVNFSAEMK